MTAENRDDGQIGQAIRLALDAMSDIYVVYDSEWRYVFQNRAQREAMRLFGIDPDTAMGKVVWDVIPFAEGTEAAANIRRTMAERVVTEWEESYSPDLRLHSRAFPTPDGGVAVIARDISDQWKAEMLHRAAEERTSALQATTAALASALTLDEIAKVIVSKGLQAVGAHAGSIALLEEDGLMHIVAHTGYKPELVAKFSHFSVNDDLPLPEAVRTARPVVLHTPEERDGRYPHLIEARKVTQGGAVAAIPMIIDGRVLGGLGFNFPSGREIDDDDVQFMTTLAQQCAQGIERARLYEAEKNARALAEDANKAKTDFLTTMSHELRTPLNAIGGYADLLQAGIRGPVTSEQVTDLDRIKRSQRHLLSLINDVLNFAKLQAGMVQVASVEFDMNAIASGVEALVAPQLLEKKIDYRFEAAEESCICRGDPEKVEQVLLNLLSNAIKFTPAGGEVSVQVECTETSVSISVSDTGTGISLDKTEAVFEPFVQLNRTKTSPNAGTGLGLAISRDLARAMDGDLTVRSEPGVGSVFTLVLQRFAREPE